MHRLSFALLIAFGLSIWPVRNVWPDTRGPDTEEIVQSLKLKTPHNSKRLDRSWPKGVSVEASGATPAETSSIDLEVNFEFNSAQLSTDAQIILERLGRALNSDELRSQRFKITGHTDAVGTEAYNLDLSRRRALSVQDYLVRRLHIGFERLLTDGMGYSQLADPAHPTGAVNRRVQVLNIGS